MTTLLPAATVRGTVLARFAAWHAEKGRRNDGVVRWTLGLACTLAAAHAIVFAVAFALLVSSRPMGLAEQAMCFVFWGFFAAVAAGVQLGITFAMMLPLMWSVGRLHVVVSVLLCTALSAWVETIAGYVWILFAPAHGIPTEALIGLGAAIGLLWGTWLPAAYALRSDRA